MTVPWGECLWVFWPKLPPQQRVAVAEGTATEVKAKTGLVMSWAPKVEVVGHEPPKVVCMVLPKDDWPGAEVGAWAWARAVCFPPLEPGGAPESTDR